LCDPVPTYAISLDEYFTYSYTMSLSQTEVYADEVFAAAVSGQATCKKDLPLSPSAASVTSRITARHQTTGVEVVLNSAYTVTLNSFPSKKGESVQETVIVPLVFPGGSQSGTYTITGEITTAKLRVVAIWLDVTKYLPTSQVLGSVTCRTGYISDTGEFIKDAFVQSRDRRATVTIRKGTTGLSSEGDPLSEITIVRMDKPPLPPVNAEVIGLVYDFRPEGASFDEPVTIRLTYDDAGIPAGAAEANLVVAVWDRAPAKWIQLDSTVDPENNIVAADATHFTPYAVMANTRPAAFGLSDFSITPAEAAIDEAVVISVLVSNTGDLEGTYQLELQVDGAVTATKTVTLAGGSSITVPFTISRDDSGSHTVSIGDLSGTLAIQAERPPPTPAAFATSDLSVKPPSITSGESVVIGALVSNTGGQGGIYELVLKIDGVITDTKEVALASGISQTVTFTLSRANPGTYAVTIDDLSGTFVVDARETLPQAPLPQPTRAVNWWLIGGSIVIGIILGLAAAFVIARRLA